MRRELRAYGRVEGSIVDADIRAQRHLANVAAQWIVTRDRKREEAEAQGRRFDEGAFLKTQLNIGTSTMRRWIIILRHWAVYERKRRAVGATGYSGSSYARYLIAEEVPKREMKAHDVPNRSSKDISDGGPEYDDITRTLRNGQPHHERLKNAVVRATQLQCLYDDLCRRTGEKPGTTIMTPAYIAAPIAPTVRLPSGEAYRGDCLGVMPSLTDHNIDLAILDLPFGLTAAHWDNLIDLNLLWAQLLRLLKPKGVVVAFGVQPFTSRLMMSQPELYRHQWHRLILNSTNFLRTDIGPLRAIEDILVFSDSGQEFTYHPPKAKLDSPYKAPIRPHKSAIYRIRAKMQNSFGDKEYDTETPISLLDFQFGPDEQEMPTQKPVSLLEFIIQTYSKAG